MAKDAKGHGSEKSGGGKVTPPASPWNYGKTLGRLGNSYPENPHPDSTTGRAMTAQGLGPQLQLPLSDQAVANKLALGHPKSVPVSVHPAQEAQAAMSRLRATFQQGDNRFGSYGKNVKDAHDRHAATYSKLTGKPAPNIYD